MAGWRLVGERGVECDARATGRLLTANVFNCGITPRDICANFELSTDTVALKEAAAKCLCAANFVPGPGIRVCREVCRWGRIATRERVSGGKRQPDGDQRQAGGCHLFLCRGVFMTITNHEL